MTEKEKCPKYTVTQMPNVEELAISVVRHSIAQSQLCALQVTKEGDDFKYTLTIIPWKLERTAHDTIVACAEIVYPKGYFVSDQVVITINTFMESADIQFGDIRQGT